MYYLHLGWTVPKLHSAKLFLQLPQKPAEKIVGKQIPRGQHWKEPALPFKKLPVNLSKPDITWKSCFRSLRLPESYAFEAWDHLKVMFLKPEITWKLCFWSLRSPESYAFEAWDHLMKAMLHPGDHPWFPHCGGVHLYSEIYWPAARWGISMILDALKCLICLSGKYLGQHWYCGEDTDCKAKKCCLVWRWMMKYYWVGERYGKGWVHMADFITHCNVENKSWIDTCHRRWALVWRPWPQGQDKGQTNFTYLF